MGLDDPLHGGGGADVQTYSYSSSTQQITVSDAEGSLQWTEKDGLRFLRATDLDGQVLFEGAITTEEDRKKMPDGVGQRLRAMQQAGQIPQSIRCSPRLACCILCGDRFSGGSKRAVFRIFLCHNFSGLTEIRLY